MENKVEKLFNEIGNEQFVKQLIKMERPDLTDEQINEFYQEYMDNDFAAGLLDLGFVFEYMEKGWL